MSIFSKPRCLIESDPDNNNRLAIVQATIDQIKQLEKPLVVVAIAGKYRTGKSYLLNRLNKGRNVGFSLGNTIESHTKGIWVWAKVHPYKTDRYILLLDTEGLGDPHKGDEDHDNQLFTLAILLSSVLCYNAMNAIDNNAINKINFISHMSEHIAFSDSGSQDGDLDLFFPTFAFVLRDFFLDLEIDGKTVTEDEYLESSLKSLPESHPNAREYNEPRLCIRKYFKKRHLFTFTFPVANRRQLKDLDTITDRELCEEFVQQSDRFCKFIEEEGKLKCLENGQPLKNGQMWASLVEDFVTSMQNGRIPTVMNAVKTMTLIENQKAIEAAKEAYMMRMMRVCFPTENERDLCDHHTDAVRESTAAFLKKCFNDTDNIYQQKLLEMLNAEFHEMKQNNDYLSREACHDTFLFLEKQFARKLYSREYRRSGGYQEYQQDLNHVTDRYKEAVELGDKKNEVLSDYMLDKWQEGQVVLQQDMAITAQQRADEERREKQRQDEKLREIQRQQQRRSDELRAQQERAQAEAVRIIRESQRRETANIRQHYQQMLDRRIAEQRALLQEGFNQQARGLQSQIDDLKRRL